MSNLNGSANGEASALRRAMKDPTAALRMRRYRQRKNDNENNTDVTVSSAASVTLSTADMCGLAARLSGGRASREDLQLADRIVTAFAMQFPPDSVVTIGAAEISDNPDNEGSPP